MISKAHRKALRTIHGRLKDLDSPWAIAGSLGLALQGMDVLVNDIDLQTDQEGAYRIQKAFRDAIVRNVTLSEADIIRSYFGELKVHGVKVEIIGALQKRLPNTEWKSPVEVQQHCTFVRFDGMNLPVLSLEHEERAYRILGRIEKADRIKEWLERGK